MTQLVSELDVSEVRVMVGEGECVSVHNTVIYKYFHVLWRIVDEEMVEGACSPVWSLPGAFRGEPARIAAVMSVVVVSENGSGLVARNITIIQKLADGHGVLLAIHVAHQEYHTIIFRLNSVSLSHH